MKVQSRSSNLIRIFNILSIKFLIQLFKRKLKIAHSIIQYEHITFHKNFLSL